MSIHGNLHYYNDASILIAQYYHTTMKAQTSTTTLVHAYHAYNCTPIAFRQHLF